MSNCSEILQSYDTSIILSLTNSAPEVIDLSNRKSVTLKKRANVKQVCLSQRNVFILTGNGSKGDNLSSVAHSHSSDRVYIKDK